MFRVNFLIEHLILRLLLCSSLNSGYLLIQIVWSLITLLSWLFFRSKRSDIPHFFIRIILLFLAFPNNKLLLLLLLLNYIVIICLHHLFFWKRIWALCLWADVINTATHMPTSESIYLLSWHLLLLFHLFFTIILYI